MSSAKASEPPIEVVAYSGYRGEQEPRALIVEGRRLEVTSIVDRWYDPGASYFRVRTDDGRTSLLRYDLETLEWSRASRAGRSARAMPHRAVRHVLATLAYRTRRVIAESPEGYADYEAGAGVRTPAEILRHMSSLLDYAELCFRDGERRPLEPVSWDREIQRFEAALRRLDRRLAAGEEPRRQTLLTLLQGPICDAMTHVGQLATLRRMAGLPVPAESFVKAPIEAGKLDVT